MSQGELGMLIVMLLCIAFTVITVVTANKRIYEERCKARLYKSLYRSNQLHLPNCRCTVAPFIEEGKRNISEVVKNL